MSDLKPCPFCGGEANRMDFNRVACKKCGIRTVSSQSFIKARDLWNTRQEDSTARNEVANKAVNWAKDYGYISTFGEYQAMKAAIFDDNQNEKCGKINLGQGIKNGTIIVSKFFEERQHRSKKQHKPAIIADKQEPPP